MGILAAALTRESMELYGGLIKPPISPPAILFPIVWTVLYILMGISSGIVYIKRESNPEAARRGLRYYLISLVFNFSWSIIFFRMRAILLALICLAALIYFIVKTVIEYYKADRVAAYLQIPYALWCGFAAYLNAAILFLN